ncbi:MAG TPA: hypothetical protein PKC76_18540 [Saprospiraceae bacterium]|nr:hypothetical protein [Saprospiraceae bacterium]HMP26133.1 hypothetical protein [Saprospiraceae bacterium]
MRKASLFAAVLLWVTATVAAQTARPAFTGQYVEQSFNQLNFDNLLAFFSSPAFKILMLLVIGAALVIWSIYLWASVQIALEDGTPVSKKRIWSWPRSVRIPAGIPADPDLPHTQVWHFGRAGLSPHIVLVAHKPDDSIAEESADTPPARSENSARRP